MRDLRNRSFAGEQLEGADFRATDLRGADFSRANLRGADFSGARTGMRRSWAIAIGTCAMAASILLGVVIGLGGRMLLDLAAKDVGSGRVLGLFLLIVFGSFLVASVAQGFLFAMRRVLPISAAIGIVAAIAASMSGVGTELALPAVLAFFVVGMTTIVLAAAARTIAGALGNVFFAVVAVSGALAGAIAGGGWAASVVAIATMLSARRAIGRHGFDKLEHLSAQIASTGGTQFRDADLAEADFHDARVTCSDFRGAALDRSQVARSRLCLFDPRLAEGVTR